MDLDLASTATQPSQFTLFPLLPLELRLKIWSFISPGPRLVAVGPSERHWRNPYHTTGWLALQKESTPVTLHICHESREEALKQYQLAFGSPFCKPQIWIDFSIDTIRLGAGPGIEEARRPDGTWTGPKSYMLDLVLGGGPHGAENTENIKSLVLDVHEDLYARKSFCWDEIRELTGLEELTLLVWEPDYVQETCLKHFREALGRVVAIHPDWILPNIFVINATSGSSWGELRLLASLERETEE